MVANLTKILIDRFTYEGPAPRKDIRWDEQLKGFGVRIYPSGRKSYVLSYRHRGRKRLCGLGNCSHMTVAEARKEARKRLVDVDKGFDPVQERKSERFEALAKKYIELHAKPHKKTWKTDQGRLNKHVLPAWRNVLAKEITRADTVALHQKIGRTAPYEANRILSVIRKMFSLAEQWGDVPEGKPNPARGIQKFAEQKRDRWITPEEMPRLAKALADEENQTAAAAIWLMLLTGLRRGECLGLQWAAVEMARREIRLGHTKAGRIHYVPLSDPAMKILRKQQRRTKGRYVFPGQDPRKPLCNIDKTWRRVKKAADMPDVRIHDLRRTVGSWMAQAGESLHLIGKVLNHSNPQTTSVYARFAQDHVRQALDSHAQAVDQYR